MPENDDHSDDAVYKVDTVPPPDGDDDAYSAPTRVGPMAATVVNELIVAANRRESAEVAAASQVKPKRSVRDEHGNEVLDEDDIEAELAFPPPPKVPTNRPPAVKTTTQPVVPVTPLSSIRPNIPSVQPASSPNPSLAPASSAQPNAPRPQQAMTAPAPKLPIPLLAIAAVVVVLLIVGLMAIFRH